MSGMLKRLPLAKVYEVSKFLPRTLRGKSGRSKFLEHCPMIFLEVARCGAKARDQVFQGHRTDGSCVEMVSNVRHPAHGGGEGDRGVEAIACVWN